MEQKGRNIIVHLNWNEKEFTESKSLKLLRVSTKPKGNEKGILIGKKKSASIIRRYETKLKMVRSPVKPKFAQKPEIE